MSGHTPGPWWPARVYGTVYIEARLVGDDRLLQEVAACGPTATPTEQEANARLIAAAPELLDVLALLIASRSEHFIDNECCDEMLGWNERANAAIAKAMGEKS